MLARRTDVLVPNASNHRKPSRSRAAWFGACVGCGIGLAAALNPVPTPRADEDREAEPIAHWTFDDVGLAEGQGEPESIHRVLDKAAFDNLPRVRGVHGRAAELNGNPRLPVPVPAGRDTWDQVTLSAWFRPTNLSGYREIFRQECDQRLLFSFQHNGTILSLGLNIGGYVECDARIDPARVLDGGWHHGAATFDGATMRVYLDGKEIGSLARNGVISVQPSIPAFLGSSGGYGEFFEGGLDDVRIYSAALGAEQVGSLFRDGIESFAVYQKEIEERVGPIFTEGKSFSETFAHSWRRFVESEVAGDRDAAAALLARVRARYPDEYDRFLKAVGASPIEYLSCEEREKVDRAARTVDLLVEYRPLTDHQWETLSPEQRAEWASIDAIRARYERLRQSGGGARYSPEWIDLMMEAADHIRLRPTVSEAVAPYVPPNTPETRDLTAVEANEALRRDWLHQAEGPPTAERIRMEIAWARALADRIAAESDPPPDLTGELAALDRFAERAATATRADAQAELYFEVRAVKRAIAFRNPTIDFSRVLFVDMPFPQGSEWPHETRHRLGYMAIPGGRLLVLDGLSPAGSLKQLMPQAPLHGSFWRPDLSFDGTKVLFCFKPHNEKSFHLYEIGIDGGTPAQRTDGPYDDLDPIYLPDGEHILFSTSRGHTYVRCMPPTNAYVLARSRIDGKDIYLVSRNNEPDYLPSLMNDGRVVYTRWEYTDKPLWRAQSLWTTHPDGTQVNTLWGNQSVWPDLMKDARAIPGSGRVMFTGSAHHNWFSGSVGIIDPARGFNFPDGLTKVTAELEWPESGNGAVDPIESPRYHTSGRYAAYYSPYPLSERDFLVSANREGKFVLYWMDTDGNRELIYEGVHNIFHAIPVRARPRPPVLPDRVDWPTREVRDQPSPGVIYSSNVYEGTPAELHGKARYLQILAIDPKTYTYWHERPYISTGPVVSLVQSDGVKRILGTVPIEDDGSVSFVAPSGKALHFQLVDEQFRALQTMRSFTGVMPGEKRGCVGCHESHTRAPRYEGISEALARAPSEITPPPWGDATVSYVRYVQPVLDRYCGECHQGTGDARDVLDLTFRPGYLMFNEPYVTLTGHPTWGRPYEQPEKTPPGFGIANTILVESYDQRDPAAYRTTEPMTRLSYRSPLIDIASSGRHYGVRVDPVNLRRLCAWIDTMCPYLGDDEIREIPDPVFQGVDWLSIRPRVKSAPRLIRPGPVD